MCRKLILYLHGSTLNTLLNSPHILPSLPKTRKFLPGSPRSATVHSPEWVWAPRTGWGLQA